MSDPQAQIQALSEEYQKLQTDLQSSVASRQKLEGQRQENLGVQKEFDALEDDETIYKLVGPVLLKQEKFEAESTVKGRLDFIGNEITRYEGLIRESQEKIEQKKMEIFQIQAAAQQGGQGQGQQQGQQAES